ncbi:MAG TPA: putative glycolipid-binding domain-containing protein [Ilumatobacter sp.]
MPAPPPTPPSTLRAFPADGFEARWETWDGGHRESLSLAWDNEAWTATGAVEREQVQYVIRLSPRWQIRQFLLFRDLPEPDLWLGTDGQGRWGEINGAHRTDLDGAYDLAMRCTPFTLTLPIRRHPLAEGDSIELIILEIDVATLGVVTVPHTFERTGARSWRVAADGESTRFDVDEFGVAIDVEGRFRRVT